MAFVAVPGSAPQALRASNFHGRAVTEARASSAAAVPSRRATRMLVEDGEVAPTKGSKWKENLFTGGIPGGEEFYRKWIADGMEGDFPDLPERMQPSQPKLEAPAKEPSFLKRVDSMEFFKEFEGEDGGKAGNVGAVAGAAAAAKSAASKISKSMPGGGSAQRVGLKIGGKSVGAGAAPVSPVVNTVNEAAAVAAQQEAALASAMAEAAASEDPEAPDEALYEKYFPKSIRNIAPEISMVSERDFFKDRVSLAMTPVTAKCTDLYFPREMEGKAPIIDIFYNGSVASASISVKLDDVEPLPASAPPVPAGSPSTQLVRGAGGGLKLEFAVDGETVSAYSDPRCTENYEKMISS